MRCVSASEGEGGQRLVTSRIKVLIGGDMIAARGIWLEPVEAVS